MARINGSRVISHPIQTQTTSAAVAQGENSPTVRTASPVATTTQTLPSVNKRSRDRQFMQRLLAASLKTTGDSGYASGDEERSRFPKSPSPVNSVHEHPLSERASVASLALSRHAIPSLASLESIPDWGSTHDIDIANADLAKHALASIRKACDLDRGVNDMAERARILETHMERALSGALQSGDAETVSYLRQQMYYMNNRKRCTDIVIGASRHLPALDTKGKARTLQEFIRLLSYRTTAGQREPVMNAILQKYPVDRLALQFEQAFLGNDAEEIADLRVLMFELSLSLDPHHLKTVAERMPDAVRQGHGAVIETSAPVLQHARGETWYGAAIINAADRCSSAPPASLADTIRGFALLASGLDHASLERVLTSLAGALPYEKSEGSLEAMRAFGAALDQHAGRLDSAARARLLAAFDLRSKPRKTGSPFRLPALRKVNSTNLEFSEARRAVRARLKDPQGNLGRTLKRTFTAAGTAPGTGSASAPR